MLTSIRREAGLALDDRRAYRAFVAALHERMLTNAPRRIELRVGRTWRWVAGQFFRSFLWADSTWAWWTGPAILTGAVLFARRDHTMPASIQIVRRNLPSRHHPAYLPDRVLPDIQAV